jgi:hypothetical protein
VPGDKTLHCFSVNVSLTRIDHNLAYRAEARRFRLCQFV